MKLMRVVTHTDDKQLKCAHCNYKTKIRLELKKHLKRHSVKSLYTCNLCTYGTNSISRLMSHKLTHVKKDVRKHQLEDESSPGCSKCTKYTGFKCNETGVLKTYMTGQNDEKLFKCNLCNYKCKWSGTLKKHFSMEHAGKEN